LGTRFANLLWELALQTRFANSLCKLALQTHFAKSLCKLALQTRFANSLWELALGTFPQQSTLGTDRFRCANKYIISFFFNYT
jgi:hypothetical protein